MAIFNYDIKTKYSEASGSLEADDKEAAEAQLTEQYGGDFADDKGKKLSNDIESIKLTEVK